MSLLGDNTAVKPSFAQRYGFTHTLFLLKPLKKTTCFFIFSVAVTYYLLPPSSVKGLKITTKLLFSILQMSDPVFLAQARNSCLVDVMS